MGREPSPDAVDNEGATDLHIAAGRNLPMLTRALLTQGADVQAKNKYGFTPLHYAVLWNAYATAEVLLTQGADVHAKANNGNTPMYVAVAGNDHKMAEVLRRYGGHTAATVEALPKQGAGARNNKSSGEENFGCVYRILGGMGIIVLIVALLGSC